VPIIHNKIIAAGGILLQQAAGGQQLSPGLGSQVTYCTYCTYCTYNTTAHFHSKESSFFFFRNPKEVSFSQIITMAYRCRKACQVSRCHLCRVLEICTLYKMFCRIHPKIQRFKLKNRLEKR
jgi:hypothetical protein